MNRYIFQLIILLAACQTGTIVAQQQCETLNHATFTTLATEGFGYLVVRSNVAGDTILIDGCDFGATGTKAIKLPVATYKLQVSKRGYVRWQQKVSVGQGETVTVKAILQPVSVITGDLLQKLGITMQAIPAGCFQMGSDSGDINEKPVHQVCLNRFMLAKYEVTVGQYQACVRAGGCAEPEWNEVGSSYNVADGSNDYYTKMGSSVTAVVAPIIGVSWDNALEFINWLQRQTGKPFRLPTEAEWEYACRGGTVETYCGGNTVSELGWFNGNSNATIHPVGLLQPNQYGLYDMSGNVWEWVADCNNDHYNGAPADGAAWLSGYCDRRVLRGGSWFNDSINLRATTRSWGFQGGRGSSGGFRLAMDISD